MGLAGKASVKMGDFPGGPVVKNSPSNAKDVGSIPGRGTKIPHALGPLSLGSVATTSACHSSREGHHQEPLCPTKTQRCQINK